MRIPKIGKETQPQKKLITLKFFEFFNLLVKSEADRNDTTESALIEKKVLDTYLNQDNQLAEILANQLPEENGIMQCASQITEMYRVKPELGNDTLLDFLRFTAELIRRHEMRFETAEEGLENLARYAREFEALIKERIEKNPTYTFYKKDGLTTQHIDTIDISTLHDVAIANKSQHILDSENVCYLCIQNVLKFWNFGGYEGLPTIKNWNVTYAMLKSVYDLYRMQDYAPYVYEPYAYEFSQVVKSIKITENNVGAFDPAINLTKRVFLQNKSFITTEDAVIMKTQENEPDRFFTHAYRVINGPGKPATQKPYILLCVGEEDAELKKVIAEKTKEYPAEFPDPQDTFYVQILYNEKYYDKRIRWVTI